MKQGFTLIELLAVIMILGLIGLIAVPTVNKVLKNSKEKLYQSQVKIIEQNAKKWAVENVNKISETETVHLNLSELIDNGYIEQTELKDPRNSKETMNGCIKIQYDNEYSKYEYSYDEKTCYEIDPIYANKPELTTGMIAVTYDETNSRWVKADTNNKAGDNQWYDYNSQMWANAVTVNDAVESGTGSDGVSRHSRDYYINTLPVGDPISMDDINTMWVWIPRYKYAIPTGTGAREINIIFESKNTTKSTGNAEDTNYRTHPAFSFGTTEVRGIWVGKFEPSVANQASTCYEFDNNCDDLSLSITIIPNARSWRNIKVQNAYLASRTMQNNTTYGTSTDGNIHMAKDSEWGSVAYLSHSKYGKYGNSIYEDANKEIYQNKSDTYITGSSNGTPSQIDFSSSQCAYNIITDRGSGTGACGAGASTTGNIYGIYDMSGGAWEYTMSKYHPSDSASDASGFEATTTNGTLPTSEYWDSYTGTVDQACNNGICYGSALSETSGWYGDNTRECKKFCVNGLTMRVCK